MHNFVNLHPPMKIVLAIVSVVTVAAGLALGLFPA